MPRPKRVDFKVIDNAADVLIKCRTEQKLSPDQFANSLSIKENYYKRIEKKTAVLTVDLARRIEKKYRITLVEEETKGGEDEVEKDMTGYLKGSADKSESMIYFKKRGQKPEYDQ